MPQDRMRAMFTRSIVSLLAMGALAAAGPDRRLPDAAKRQDRRAVQALLKEHAEINASHADGATALHWAVHWDDLETAQLLMQAGADANAANDFGVTPLSLACTNGNATMVKLLLAAGADPNAALATGETPLMTAARSGSTTVVVTLLENGAKVEAQESAQGQTALMWAVSEEHRDVVRALTAHGANLRARSRAGFTPALFAARSGNLEILRQLLEAGAEVDDAAPDGSTALLVATVRGHTALARLLLEKGADANADAAGYTALHWAAGSWETELTGPRGIATDREKEWSALGGLGQSKLELVHALLAHGANPNVRVRKAPPRVGFTVFRLNLAGATPFFLAAMAGDARIMQALADAGADPKLGTNDGTMPLQVAAGVGRILAEARVSEANTFQAVMLAWRLGGDVNAANGAGETALHGAAHIRNDAVVQFLVDKGAAVDVKNKRGQTPLSIAERTVAAGSAPVLVRTSTGDLLRKLGAKAE